LVVADEDAPRTVSLLAEGTGGVVRTGGFVGQSRELKINFSSLTINISSKVSFGFGSIFPDEKLNSRFNFVTQTCRLSSVKCHTRRNR